MYTKTSFTTVHLSCSKEKKNTFYIIIIRVRILCKCVQGHAKVTGLRSRVYTDYNIRQGWQKYTHVLRYHCTRVTRIGDRFLFHPKPRVLMACGRKVFRVEYARDCACNGFIFVRNAAGTDSGAPPRPPSIPTVSIRRWLQDGSRSGMRIGCRLDIDRRWSNVVDVERLKKKKIHPNSTRNHTWKFTVSTWYCRCYRCWFVAFGNPPELINNNDPGRNPSCPRVSNQRRLLFERPTICLTDLHRSIDHELLDLFGN